MRRKAKQEEEERRKKFIQKMICKMREIETKTKCVAEEEEEEENENKIEDHLTELFQLLIADRVVRFGIGEKQATRADRNRKNS
jgi:hypothetical protein